MKTWKKIFIVACCVFALAALLFSGLLCRYYYEKKHPFYSYVPSPILLSDSILMEYVKGYGHDRVRLKDMRTGQYTTPQMQHVYITEFNASDSLVVFRSLDYERGYVNIYTGKIVIPAQYSRAWNFSESMAAVYKDGVVSFINTCGDLAFPNTFPIRYDDDYSEIALQFHNGLCVMRTMDNKWGLINTQGEWVIEPAYNTIGAPQQGFRIALKGDKYALIDSAGRLALLPEYDLIRFAEDGQGFIIAKDGIAKEVDWNFNILRPFVYDGLHKLSFVCSYRTLDYYDDNGIHHLVEEPEYWRYDIGPFSGVIDTKGHVIIPAKYYMIQLVNNHLFEVQLTSNGDYILINSKGQIIH